MTLRGIVEFVIGCALFGLGMALFEMQFTKGIWEAKKRHDDRETDVLRRK